MGMGANPGEALITGTEGEVKPDKEEQDDNQIIGINGKQI